jgi:hypothetical protein
MHVILHPAGNLMILAELRNFKTQTKLLVKKHLKNNLFSRYMFVHVDHSLININIDFNLLIPEHVITFAVLWKDKKNPCHKQKQ